MQRKLHKTVLQNQFVLHSHSNHTILMISLNKLSKIFIFIATFPINLVMHIYQSLRQKVLFKHITTLHYAKHKEH